MTIRKNENGTWLVKGKAKTAEGKYISYYKNGFSKKSEAVIWEENKRIQIQKPDGDHPERYRLDTVFDRFAETGPSGLGMALQTYKGYFSVYRKWIHPTLGHLYLDQITDPVLQDWWSGILKTPGASRHKLDFKNKLSCLFNFAIKMGYTDFNPVKSSYLVPPVVTPIKKDELWTPEMLKTVISYGWNNDYDQVLFFLFWTGLRVGEATGLRWKDIDFKNKTLTIHQTMSPATTKKQIIVNAPKSTTSFRTINLQTSLITLLEIRKDILNDPDPDSWVFTHFPGTGPYMRESGQPMSVGCLRTYFVKLQALVSEKEPDANIPYIPLKALRSSHASWLIFHQIDDQLIATRMGHSVKTLRQCYAHIYAMSRASLTGRLVEITTGKN